MEKLIYAFLLGLMFLKISLQIKGLIDLRLNFTLTNVQTAKQTSRLLQNIVANLPIKQSTVMMQEYLDMMRLHTIENSRCCNAQGIAQMEPAVWS